MKSLTYIIFTFIILSCSTTNRQLTKEKITFNKSHIGQRKSYSIYRPAFKNKEYRTSLFIGGHGNGFQIIYSDSATIYYSNDRYISSPNQYNYSTIGWKGFEYPNEQKDTIISGQQSDGRLWKEIRKGNDYIGYFNVSPTEKLLFDKAITTFKK